MRLQLGGDEFVEAGQLTPTPAELGGAELRARLEADGYLYIPHLLARPLIEECYAAARGVLEEEGLWPGVKFSAGWRSCPQVMAVAEAPQLKDVCTALFDGAEAGSYPFKWLRTSGPGNGTGFQ